MKQSALALAVLAALSLSNVVFERSGTLRAIMGA